MKFFFKYTGKEIFIGNQSIKFLQDDAPESLLSYTIRNYIRLDDVSSTFEVIKNYPEAHDLMTETICAFLMHLQKRLNITVTVSTILRFRQTYDMVMKYEADTNRSFKARDFSIYFMDHFTNWLRSKNYKPNTISVHVRNLQKIEEYAVAYKILPFRESASFSFTAPPVSLPFLLITDIKRIEQKSFIRPKLELTRLLFLFQCYTGLSYADLAVLTEADFETTGRNAERLVYHRKKTGKRCVIPLLKEARVLKVQLIALSKTFRKRSANSIFYVPLCQNYNIFLKELSKDLNLSVPVSSHTARRTFATTIALTNGASLSQTATLLGHSKLRETIRYVSVTDEKLEREFRPLIKSANRYE